MTVSQLGMESTGNRNVPLQALRPKTKGYISDLLNPFMIIPADGGILRYWKGLAGLCKIEPSFLASIEDHPDPTSKVLQLWFQQDPQRSTVSQFLLFLEEMDRFDIIADLSDLIDEDIKIFEANPQEFTAPNLEYDKFILTDDDVERLSEGLPLETYDAFVLYDQDDIGFATQLIDTMENTHGMKFVVRDRDLVGGGLELEKMIKLITNRCNRIIVVLSDAFFKSSANQYYLSFAQAYGLDSERKIIPCVYKDCTLPADMKYLFILDYRRMQIFNFWSKLKRSLIVVNDNVKVNQSAVRSKSVNGDEVRSALGNIHGNELRKQVTYTVSTGDLDQLETLPCPPSLLPSSSAENLGVEAENVKKKKLGLFERFLIKRPVKKTNGDSGEKKKKVFGLRKKREKVMAINY